MPVSYQRNNAAGVAFASAANVSDIGSTDFDKGLLTISVTGGEVASNRIFLTGSLFTVDAQGNLRRGSVVIGTVASGAGIGSQPFSVAFNSSARSSTVTELLKALRFSTVGSTSNHWRRISVSLFDGDGGRTQGIVPVTVTT